MKAIEFVKIGELSERLGISRRTLRYYEELGLISSIRDEDSNYRYYTGEAEQVLKQILVLRKIDISLKNILEIYNSNNQEVITRILNNKIEEIDQNIESMSEAKVAIEKIVELFREKEIGADNQGKNIQQQMKIIERIMKEETNIKKESTKMNNKKLSDNEVRKIRIKPCKVAYYRAISSSPETDAWNVMRKWVRDNNLVNKSLTRYFGFNNPNPVEGKAEYGYEVWVTIDENTKESGEIKFKDFNGGVYLVTTSNGVFEIGECWKKLGGWAKAKGYIYGRNQWLEENIVVDESLWGDNMQIDLYFPIEE